jgi:hypothetical protein
VRASAWTLTALLAAASMGVAATAGRRAEVPRHEFPEQRPAARSERPVPFAPGEELSYDVSWSTFVTAGVATLSVKEKKPSNGSTAYYVVAEGRPTPLLSKLYHLYYKADTLLDSYSLLPQRGSIYSEEGGRHRLKTTSFNQDARKAVFEMQTSTTMKKDLALPPYTQDALSAILVLRAVPLAPGAKITMPVADSGNVLKVQITAAGRESVRTGLGAIDAVRISPVILDEHGAHAGRAMSLWISDDARRLPVKLQADLAVGSFVLTLKSASGVRQ